jgi:chromosome segregation ATPase
VKFRTKATTETETSRLEVLAEKIAAAVEELGTLTGEVRALRKEKDQTTEVIGLREEISKLRIEQARLVEENERATRDIEHKVGLHQRQVEQDTANAVREAELKVKEGNLEAEQKRFKEQIDFRTDQMKGEMDRFEKITTQLLDRVPNINAALDIKYGNGAVSAKSDED